jgi:hypothetical protein
MTQWIESCSQEPTLNDMLDDPIVLELMERDHVARDDLEKLMLNVWTALSIEKHQMNLTSCQCAPRHA